jgi:mannose-1-phosphate guanylyltransferase/mannose-6-phosphate isomerase
MIIPVILCGGSGTRLWPLSTPDRPKQFLPLVSERTLFQETLLRLAGLTGLGPPIVVCNAAHRMLVATQLRSIEMTAGTIVLEPEGRNTAPAIAVAALLSTGTESAGRDPVLLVLPADHVIADGAAFRVAIEHAVAAAGTGRLVTFGIVPARPETGYGYIEQGEGTDFAGGARSVARFVEKPDREAAERYLASGRFLWNSGMFVFGAGAFLAELAHWAPAMHAACVSSIATARRDADFTHLGSEFLACPAGSIDHAVMEKTSRAAVVPLDAGWSDVGSWSALYDVLAKNEDGNALRGDVTALGARDNLVISGSRGISLLGVDGLVVVDAGDRLLILRRDQSQRVREILTPLNSNSGSR